MDPTAIRWITPAGAGMKDADWADDGAKSIAMVLSGSADPDVADDGSLLVDDDFAVLINAWWEPLTFATGWFGGQDFIIESDSYEPERRGRHVTGGSVDVGPRAVLVIRRT